ncbi:Aromatic-ring-hydroxylating dioxygenase, beta subunit [Rhodococcus wratislaviensis]|uniref:Aromatic-ring-hydroxylating dioxygenase, beta subunit n=1 Tax=Rhodococcus wratislaviensis TaxID=44752 RepID=A0A402CK24_RHOWR|nr:aromatic-ring-hydroxylating dioxygenase subunit beta [Rhodococcus wratislaviensis]GCE43952.1 Aromatic-ring-hydroxylating dioxygenase, beta subunit [Rhodococcus wratislaviensis]
MLSAERIDVAADDATFASVSRFYGRETALLDAHDYARWIPLLEPEFVYRIPVTVTRDDPSQSPFVAGAHLLDESRDSLANLWARRLEPDHIDFSWGEVPLQRVRRFVSVLSVADAGRADEVSVTSNVLVTVVHQSDPVVMTAAGRHDILRHRGDGWGLVERTVHLDESVVRLPHLRMVI